MSQQEIEQKTTSVVGKVKFNAGSLECPFDLGDVFSVQVNSENLKGVLEWIIGNLGTITTEMKELDTRVMAKMMQISK